MTDAALALRQLKFENRAFWRNPAAAFFTVFLPLMFLVIFNAVFGDDPIELEGGTADESTFYIPAIAALSVISACFTNIAMMVSFARDEGLLKRLRGSPLPAWAFLFGKVVHAVGIAVLLVVVITAVGALFYGVDVPGKTMPALILTLAVGAAAFCVLGLAVTAIIPNAEASPAIVNGVVLPLLFISDVFIPLEEAPGWLKVAGELFPVRHFSESLQTAFNPFETGWGFEFARVAVIAAWGVAGLIAAVRFFSWEPRR